MSSPFLTEPVVLWEYLSLHTQTQECCKYNYQASPYPKSSQTVTAINGTEPSWVLQILLYSKPVDKCYTTASIIQSHMAVTIIDSTIYKKFIYLLTNHQDHLSVLPKGRSFTTNSGTKAAVLPKGRSSTANSGTKVADLIGVHYVDACGCV